jgi:beta-glucosidase
MSSGARLVFPDHFFWGTSTAAAQIETASDHNWRGVRAKDGSVLERTCDHERRRDEDLRYIRQFGTVYRCGFDWARLQPAYQAEFDEDAVAEYRDWLEALRRAGMKVMFVLHHFTHPRWLEDEGGWLNEKAIPAYVDFTCRCIKHFGDLVSYWNTFNEPNVFAMNAYLLGNFPPFKKSYRKANRVLRHMGQAHEIAHELIKDAYTDAPIGISLNTGWFEGRNLLGRIAATFTDWWFHRHAARFFTKVDFWGLSYYAYVPFAPGPVTEIDQPGRLDRMGIPHDMMWGYYPEGLGKQLRRFWKRYGKPLIVTENGICTDDPARRIQAIKDYLTVCHQVTQEGVPLQGYIFWSTFDNFEWHLGNTYRFGLVRIDWDTMDRTFTPAAQFYAQVTQDNALSP